MYRADDFRHLAVLVSHLPPDSATSRARGHSGLTTADRVLLDVFQVLAGQMHPADPFRVAEAAKGSSLSQRLVAQRERARQMREAQNGR